MTLNQYDIDNKHAFTGRGRKSLQSKFESYKIQLKTIPKYTSGKYFTTISPRWIEVKSKMELCEELLNG